MEKFTCLVYLLLLSWAGCCIGVRNEIDGIQQLPVIRDQKIYFSAVIETSKINTQPSHVVVFVLNPFPVISANATVSGGSLNARRRKANNDVDCLLAPSSAPQNYVVTSAMHIPGNEPSGYFDVFRCEIPWTILHGDVASANSSLLVHLLSGSTGSLVKFLIPHDSRSTGYLSTPVQVSGNVGYPNTSATRENPVFHLLVPCVAEAVSHELIVRLVEFIQHHILLGVNHIVMGFPYQRDSKQFGLVMQSLLSFVNSNHLTIVSLHDQSNVVTKLTNIQGILKYKRISNLLFNNLYLYLSKGIADHVGVWGSDSYFIPQNPAVTIPEVLANQRDEDGNLLPGDESAHPNCQYSVPIRVLRESRAAPLQAAPYAWIGDRYSPEVAEVGTAHQNAVIFATDTVYRVGISGFGEACRLPLRWTRCKQDTIDSSVDRLADSTATSSLFFCSGHSRRGDRLDVASSPAVHDLDNSVSSADTRQLGHQQGGSLVRFVARGVRERKRAKYTIITNEYKARFFDNVLQELKNRGVEIINSLPIDDNIEAPSVSIELNWVNYKHTAAAKTAAERFLPPPVIPKRQSKTAADLTSGHDEPTGLPRYAVDYTEFIYGALIERKADSLDLHLAVFMVCPSMTRATRHVEGLENTQKNKWKKLMLANRRPKYDLSGTRKIGYTCRIKNDKDSSTTYEEQGHFMPNRLTPDTNANGNVDIMRCQLQDTAYTYTHLAGNEGSELSVEILRGAAVIVSFTVPWKSRQTGYMLNSPPQASRFNSWIGKEELLISHNLASPSTGKMPKISHTNGDRNDRSGRQDLFMCVPGMESPFDRRLLPLYAEFLEHHFQLGVKHMFVAATYMWGGESMDNLLGAFSSYIEDGMLSVSSNTVGVGASDYMYSVNGIGLGRDTVKVIYTNMCLYYSKGVADYVGIWDFDEFFIPRLPHNSIMDVVLSLDTVRDHHVNILRGRNKELLKTAQSWKGLPGFADGDGHRACYILLDSETITSSPDERKDAVWIGEKFAHGSHKSRFSFQKPIFPTDRIWQASLHTGGACSLPSPWVGCNNSNPSKLNYPHSSEFCYAENMKIAPDDSVYFRNQKGILQTFSGYHAFNEPLREHDAKRASIKTDAIIYHIQAHRMYLKTEEHHAHLLEETNEYTARFFDSVYSGLLKRGIAILQELPHLHPEVDVFSSLSWPRLKLPRSLSMPVKNDTRMSVLPSFSSEGSEFLLSAIIERAANVDDLYATCFFLSHAMLDFKKRSFSSMKVNPVTKPKWDYLSLISQKSRYSEEGVRILKEPFTCKIRNSLSEPGSEYVTTAEFIPNKLTPDSNANKRLDILRCKLQHSAAAYERYAGKVDNITVEIFHGDSFVIKFQVPWSSRRVGHMMEPQEHSFLNPWIGYFGGGPNSGTTSSERVNFGEKSSGTGYSVGVAQRDDLHMCVPGLESPPDKEMLPLYAEFVQHHISLGVKHIHIGTMFAWDSQAMRDISQILGGFIRDGLVTVTTQTDGPDLLYSTAGLTWDRDDSKIFFVNMCLYYAKGVSDYVGIWDFDEFFIPRSPFRTIMDIVNSVEENEPGDNVRMTADLKDMSVDKAKEAYRSGPGLADGDAHPFCYILLSSESVHNHPEERSFNFNEPWIGQRYDHLPEKKSTHAFKKSILPTEKIFYAGLHMSGACKLPPPWNGCKKGSHKEFCYSDKPKDFFGLSYTVLDKKQVDFSFYQVFNGVVMDKDTKQIRTSDQGVIYHFQFHRTSMLTSLLTTKSEKKNEYATRFFPEVYDELKARGITLMEDFPSLLRRGNNELFGPKWTRAEKFFAEQRV